MRPLALLVFVSLVGAALVPAQEGRGEGQFRIAVGIDLVVFNLAVTDARGRHVPGLTAADFEVLEDHRPQEITLFRAEDVPSSVGLVVDTSGSMNDRRSDVIRAALAFTDASNPDDELFVVNFNERVSLGLPSSIPFTRDPIEIRLALLRATPVGLTALYDALALGLEHLSGGTRDRKALVVLSDGGDNASQQRLDDVLQMAQRSSATIYTVGIYDEADRDQNPRVLRTIARQSGGRAFFPSAPRDLEGVWRTIAGDIRHQYTIGYTSTNTVQDGTFRAVSIRAGRARGVRLRVATRDGYRTPGRASTESSAR